MVRAPKGRFSARLAEVEQDAAWAVQRVRHSPPVQKLGRRVRRAIQRFSGPTPHDHAPLKTQWVRHTAEQWPVSVLTIGERSLPQCYHYRLRQKADVFDRLGVPYDELGLDDLSEATSRLQLARVLILYRLPHDNRTVAVVEEARRLGVPVVFEVDDVVYRQDLVAANPNLATLPWSLRATTIRGARDYERLMQVADINLASTQTLADDMAARTGRPAFVLENGIDDQMLEIADSLGTDRTAAEAAPTIVYGSGSRAHDHDFALAAGGIVQWLQENPDGRVTLIGNVAVPPALQHLNERIRRLPELPFAEYLRELHRSTIALAPLTADPFNRYKSNIRYLESALVGTPLVASPMVYGDSIKDGRTGVVAQDHDWYAAITRLMSDADLRSRISSQARADVAGWELSRRPAAQAAAFLGALVPGWEGAAA